VSSVPSLALTASRRLIILTKAWRLSLLTMQVWTVPNRVKMLRSSASEQLFRQLLVHMACEVGRADTYVTPPTKSVRLKTLMWPEGKLRSNSIHLSTWGRSWDGLWLCPWRPWGLRWR
jgi:hypothetical protein